MKNIKKDLTAREFCKQITNHTGNTLISLRKERCLELKNISTELEVSIQQYRKYELGINRISLGRLLLILNYLEYDIHKFIDEIMNKYSLPCTFTDRIPGFKNIEKLSPNQYKLIESIIKEMINYKG